MFFFGAHFELSSDIEAIGASFAIYEYEPEKCNFCLVSCNSMYAEGLVGKPMVKVVGQPISTVFPKYLCSPLIDLFHRCVTEKIALETEIVQDYKAIERWWRSIISPITEKSFNKTRIIQTCVEITEKKLLESRLDYSMRRYEAVVQSAHDGIVTIDEQQNIRMMNEAAKEIFGYSEEEIVGKPLTQLMPVKCRRKHVEYVEGFKASTVESRTMQSRALVQGLKKNGVEFPIEVTISKLNIKNSTEMTAVVRDISEKHRLIEELYRSSQEDPLTHLYNRRYFISSLKDEIARCKRFGHRFILVMLDIDHFKLFNDKHGHACGDFVLKRLSGILKNELGETDVIARWGGEEFLVLLPEVDIEAGLMVAEKIRASVQRAQIKYEQKILQVTVSIGVESFDHETMNIDDILMNVDKALYKSKVEGRNRVSVL
ncbi:MAG: diguanylate cyclase [Candidatus Competibacterales bacterium]